MLKSTALVMGLFFSLTTYAQCLGDLCKGETIIDSSNYVGVITDIKDGQIVYRRQGNSYDNSSSPSSLSEKVSSKKIPDGSYVIDGSNYIGQVKNVFADGRIEYRREGNSYNNVSRDLSPEVSESKGIKKGVAVIDESNYVGISKRIFENGKIQYRRDGNSYDNVSTRLEPEISEIKGISKNKKVIDDSNYVGKAERVFRDGRIQYRRAGNNYSNVSKNLVVEVESISNISSGTNVLDDSNYSGKAEASFQDGRIQYRRDGNNYSNISSRLAHEIPNLKNGTKSGTVVLDQSNYVGKVNKVYNDGRTLYRRKGNNYNNVGSDLSYEVDEHKEYSKNVEYASPGHNIGEVLHFFSNDKLELSADNGSEVCDKLFSEAQEVDGVTIGTEIVLPMMSASVEKIFENSTAKITLKSKIHSVRVIKSEELDNEAQRLAWLLSLKIVLQYPDMTSSLAVKKSDYPRLLSLLQEDLKENRLDFKRKEIKEMEKHIENELEKLKQ